MPTDAAYLGYVDIFMAYMDGATQETLYPMIVSWVETYGNQSVHQDLIADLQHSIDVDENHNEFVEQFLHSEKYHPLYIEFNVDNPSTKSTASETQEATETQSTESEAMQTQDA